MKIDILAIGAHPDDVELAASGTLIKHKKAGYKTGIVDLTQGELGTRGSAALRLQEATNAAEMMKLDCRENLKLKDGFFEVEEAQLLKVVEAIRKYQPNVVFANAIQDRHPDHGRGSELVSRACFLSGLVRIDTNQEPWRPNSVYHYIQDRNINPDFVVDISEHWDQKMKSILAYSSQFYNPESDEPNSPISSKEFIQFLESRAREFGRMIGAEFGEGFTTERPVGVNDIFSLK